jgi:hypothetical protein
MSNGWRIFLEGLEFILPTSGEDVRGFCGHVVQCPNGHYAVLRLPEKVDPRTANGDLICHRCRKTYPGPAPG